MIRHGSLLVEVIKNPADLARLNDDLDCPEDNVAYITCIDYYGSSSLYEKSVLACGYSSGAIFFYVVNQEENVLRSASAGSSRSAFNSTRLLYTLKPNAHFKTEILPLLPNIRITCLRFSPDGLRLAVGYADGVVKLFDFGNVPNSKAQCLADKMRELAQKRLFPMLATCSSCHRAVITCLTWAPLQPGSAQDSLTHGLVYSACADGLVFELHSPVNYHANKNEDVMSTLRSLLGNTAHTSAAQTGREVYRCSWPVKSLQCGQAEDMALGFMRLLLINSGTSENISSGQTILLQFPVKRNTLPRMREIAVGGGACACFLPSSDGLFCTGIVIAMPSCEHKNNLLLHIMDTDGNLQQTLLLSAPPVCPGAHMPAIKCHQLLSIGSKSHTLALLSGAPSYSVLVIDLLRRGYGYLERPSAAGHAPLVVSACVASSDGPAQLITLAASMFVPAKDVVTVDIFSCIYSAAFVDTTLSAYSSLERCWLNAIVKLQRQWRDQRRLYTKANEHYGFDISASSAFTVFTKGRIQQQSIDLLRSSREETELDACWRAPGHSVTEMVAVVCSFEGSDLLPTTAISSLALELEDKPDGGVSDVSPPAVVDWIRDTQASNWLSYWRDLSYFSTHDNPEPLILTTETSPDWHGRRICTSTMFASAVDKVVGFVVHSNFESDFALNVKGRIMRRRAQRVAGKKCSVVEHKVDEIAVRSRSRPRAALPPEPPTWRSGFAKALQTYQAHHNINQFNDRDIDSLNTDSSTSDGDTTSDENIAASDSSRLLLSTDPDEVVLEHPNPHKRIHCRDASEFVTSAAIPESNASLCDHQWAYPRLALPSNNNSYRTPVALEKLCRQGVSAYSTMSAYSKNDQICSRNNQTWSDCDGDFTASSQRIARLAAAQERTAEPLTDLYTSHWTSVWRETGEDDPEDVVADKAEDTWVDTEGDSQGAEAEHSPSRDVSANTLMSVVGPVSLSGRPDSPILEGHNVPDELFELIENIKPLANKLLDFSVRPFVRLSRHLSGMALTSESIMLELSGQVENVPVKGAFSPSEIMLDSSFAQMARDVAVTALVAPVGGLLGLEAMHNGSVRDHAAPTHYSDHSQGMAPEHNSFLHRLKRYAQSQHAFPFLAVTSCVAFEGLGRGVSSDLVAHLWTQRLLGRQRHGNTDYSLETAMQQGFFASSNERIVARTLASPARRTISDVLSDAGLSPSGVRFHRSDMRQLRLRRRTARRLLKDIFLRLHK